MNILKNIFKVVVGNASTILSGIFIGFLLPKIVSLSDYGFYKIFTLYFNYLGVLSLGIIDGIVLKYGGNNYDEFDKEKFRSFFAWYTIIHVAFTLIILIVALILKDADYKFVILMLGANLFAVNVNGYFQQVSQITQRFKEYSAMKIFQSVANVLLVGFMFLMFQFEFATVTYRIYLWGYLGVNAIIASWYIYSYREIVFGARHTLKNSIKDVFSLAKYGFPLLLANLCSTLMLSMDRQLVSIVFKPEEYAVYAFAYSILSLITVATSSVSAVIYPMFKRMDLQALKNNYQYIQFILLAFIFGVLIVFYPLCYFINWFLPAYTYSLKIFRIILPGLAISSSVTVIMHNYYKVFGKSSLFFKKSIVALIISVCSNVSAFLIFKTREAISMSSIISLLAWYVISETTIVKESGYNFKNMAYMIGMIAMFYLLTIIKIYWLGMVINILGYIVTTLFVYRQEILNLKNTFIRKKEGVE